jgi:hypothetical protein
MNELANAEYQALHLSGKSAEAFRKSAYGHAMERNQAQLNRYNDTYNDDTLPIYLEREYLYNGPAGKAGAKNPHLAQTENPKRVVAHYALAMKDLKKGRPERMQAFAEAYPEVAEFYQARREAPGYAPAVRKQYDFSDVPRQEGYIRNPVAKILNPRTGKYVSPHGSLGRRLAQRYEFGTGHGLQGMGYY